MKQRKNMPFSRFIACVKKTSGNVEVVVESFVFVEGSSADGILRYHVRLLKHGAVSDLSEHSTFAEAQEAANRINSEMDDKAAGEDDA
ncbi:hypothetical protein WG901_08775 [Novosphingobium sp. PS1R-30]|uniref:Uncharacterized protein n=1 Tax=Novosphingobium anseongense TaxID=3133436 RepID=A0ABU8RUE3_9SPHN